MSRSVFVVCLVLLSLDLSASVVRRRRIVGGQPASPPPPGASEREDVVVNPAFASDQTGRPNSVSTTKRPTRPTPVYGGDDNGPIVFLRRGRREAKVRGRKEAEDVYAFKGIRYAEAPVGPYRFQVNILSEVVITRSDLAYRHSFAMRLPFMTIILYYCINTAF